MCSYDSFIQFHYRQDKKADSWINDEIKPYLRKRYYDSLKVPQFFIPPEITGNKVECKCGYIADYDFWVRKTPPSFRVQLNEGFVIPTTYKTECPNCREAIELQLKNNRLDGYLKFYGDEAKRETQNHIYWVYSHVCFNGGNSKLNEFKDSFFDIKSKISKTGTSSGWVLHTTELLSREARVAHQECIDNEDVVLEALNGLARLVGDYVSSGDMNIFSSVASFKKHLRTKKQHQLKSLIQSQNIIHCIDRATSSNLSPHFYFERTGDDGALKNFISGARCTLAWPFLTKGLPVRTPKFVPPDFNFMLEIADLVCFMIARTIYEQNTQAKRIPLDIKSLGEIRYLHIDRNKRWKTYVSDSKPPYT